MLIYIHGNDLVKTRTYLTQIQTKLKVEHRIERELIKSSVSELMTDLPGINLFGERCFYVFNLTALDKDDFLIVHDILVKAANTTEIIGLFSKPLDKRSEIYKKVCTAKVLELSQTKTADVFKLNSYVFSKRRAEAYAELAALQAQGEDQFKLFSMLMYHLRLLTLAVFNASSFEKLHPVVKQKLASQTKLFTKQTVKALVQSAYKLDVAIKTGNQTIETGFMLFLENILAMG